MKEENILQKRHSIKNNAHRYGVEVKYISFLIITSFLFLFGCTQGKFVQNASMSVVPSWVEDSRQHWEIEDMRLYKASETLRGTASPDACFQIIILDLEETIITEIKVSLYPYFKEASLDFGEPIELFTSLLDAVDIEKIVEGLRIKQTYWEQYTLKYGGSTALTCYSIGEISQKNYQITKNNIIKKILLQDSRLKRFFTNL